MCTGSGSGSGSVQCKVHNGNDRFAGRVTRTHVTIKSVGSAKMANDLCRCLYTKRAGDYSTAYGKQARTATIQKEWPQYAVLAIYQRPLPHSSTTHAHCPAHIPRPEWMKRAMIGHRIRVQHGRLLVLDIYSDMQQRQPNGLLVSGSVSSGHSGHRGHSMEKMNMHSRCRKKPTWLGPEP